LQMDQGEGGDGRRTGYVGGRERGKGTATLRKKWALSSGGTTEEVEATVPAGKRGTEKEQKEKGTDRTKTVGGRGCR